MAITAPAAPPTHEASPNGQAIAPTTPKGYQPAAHLTSAGPFTLHPGPHLFSDWR